MRALLVSVALLLAACSGDDDSLIPKNLSLFLRADNAADCGRLRGAWHRDAGDASRGVCIIPTPDAGAACTGSDECAAFCVVKIRPEPLEIGDPVVGQCHENYYFKECFDLVEDGRYTGGLCID